MKPSARLGISVLFCLAILGWSGSHSALLAQNPQVTSANPSAAAQGTINLDVIIGGSGFKRGAQAQWFITGTTNPGGVVVNSTAFNSSNQLTANITVSDTADIASYDILVYSGGRTGKGTGLFKVVLKGTSIGCDANVTTVLYDTDGSFPFQLQSDGFGAYVTYGNISSQQDNAISAIQGSCSWVLDTRFSVSRGFALTFAYPASSGQPAPPFVGPQTGHNTINTMCVNNPDANGLNFGTLTFVGQTINCGMTVGFDYIKSGPRYGVHFNANKWAGGTWAKVTCTGVSSGSCNAWTVTPDPTAGVNPSTGQPAALGELVQVTNKGEIPMGLYYMSFNILIHK